MFVQIEHIALCFSSVLLHLKTFNFSLSQVYSSPATVNLTKMCNFHILEQVEISTVEKPLRPAAHRQKGCLAN